MARNADLRTLYQLSLASFQANPTGCDDNLLPIHSGHRAVGQIAQCWEPSAMQEQLLAGLKTCQPQTTRVLDL